MFLFICKFQDNNGEYYTRNLPYVEYKKAKKEDTFFIKCIGIKEIKNNVDSRRDI